MAFDKDAFLTALDSMTVMELNDLVKAIEEKFGVSAAAMSAPAAGGGAAAPAAEEKTEFNVVLLEAGANKVQVIKAVREIGDCIKPSNCASKTSFEGMLANCFTPFTSKALPPYAPPRITNLSLVFANSATTFAAATASTEKL